MLAKLRKAWYSNENRSQTFTGKSAKMQVLKYHFIPCYNGFICTLHLRFLSLSNPFLFQHHLYLRHISSSGNVTVYGHEFNWDAKHAMILELKTFHDSSRDRAAVQKDRWRGWLIREIRNQGHNVPWEIQRWQYSSINHSGLPWLSMSIVRC